MDSIQAANDAETLTESVPDSVDSAEEEAPTGVEVLEVETVDTEVDEDAGEPQEIDVVDSAVDDSGAEVLEVDVPAAADLEESLEAGGAVGEDAPEVPDVDVPAAAAPVGAPEADEFSAEDDGEVSEGAAAGGEMGELAVEDWDYQRPKRGQIRTGVILSIRDQEIVVDVDAKRDGIVPYADMQRMGPEALAQFSEGDEVMVYILRPEDQEGNLLVSLFQARQAQSWQRAAELADSGDIFDGEVQGYNKGGLVVPVGDVRGFVPASQLSGFPQGLSQEERLRRLSELVGEPLKVKVIEINRRNRRLILSATAAEREWRQGRREELLDELREGEVRSGTVSSLCSFGAFVDLGGADGLVHLSELSWRRVRHPREAVSVGEKVDVYVMRLDREKKRIGLSLKRLQPEPWALVEDKYELGQLVEGTVTNVVDFGAFAEIDEGVEGLIHVSELTEQKIAHPRDVVKKGDLLLLRIIRIDIRRRRLGLSLKRVLEAEWAEWAARMAVSASAEEDKVEKPVPVMVPEPEPVEPVPELDAEAEPVVAEELAVLDEPVEEPPEEETEPEPAPEPEADADADAEAEAPELDVPEEPAEEPAEEETEPEPAPEPDADADAEEEADADAEEEAPELDVPEEPAEEETEPEPAPEPEADADAEAEAPELDVLEEPVEEPAEEEVEPEPAPEPDAEPEAVVVEEADAEAEAPELDVLEEPVEEPVEDTPAEDLDVETEIEEPAGTEEQEPAAEPEPTEPVAMEEVEEVAAPSSDEPEDDPELVIDDPSEAVEDQAGNPTEPPVVD